MAASLHFTRRSPCSMFRILSSKSYSQIFVSNERNADFMAKGTSLFLRRLYFKIIRPPRVWPEDQRRKVMVARLKQGENETDVEKLREYFSCYGQVQMARVVRDKETGRSKGFGFVTFADTISVENTLYNANHNIDGKGVKVFLASKPGEGPRISPYRRNVYSDEEEGRKVLVSGLNTGKDATTEEGLKEYFSRYGEVEAAYIVLPNNYGFVTFKDLKSVENVLSDAWHEINGWGVDVRMAMPEKEKYEQAKRKRTIHISNVPSGTTYKELGDHFSKFGEVKEVTAVESDHSSATVSFKVVFSSVDAANVASEDPWQELPFRGEIRVKSISDPCLTNSISFCKAPENITLEDLRAYFEEFGQIRCLDLTSSYRDHSHFSEKGLLVNSRIGEPKVEFTTNTAVERVLESPYHVVWGHKLKVRKLPNNSLRKMHSYRSLMLLVDNLPRDVDRETVSELFTVQSLAVKSVNLIPGIAGDISAVVGFWNLDDVDTVISRVSTDQGFSISGKPVVVRRLHWRKAQGEVIQSDSESSNSSSDSNND